MDIEESTSDVWARVIHVTWDSCAWRDRVLDSRRRRPGHAPTQARPATTPLDECLARSDQSGARPNRGDEREGAFQDLFPVERFNELARQGTAGQKLAAILEATKPESIYFTGNQSGRGAVAVYDLADGSQVPAVGEPWFLTFDAHIEYSLAISGEEMQKANLDDVIKRWA